MDKNEMIEKIYNFKNVELSQEELNYKIKIMGEEGLILNSWEEFMVNLSYTNASLSPVFLIEVELEHQKIKIEKPAKAIFKELKNGKFQLKISKLEAKNLASLMCTAHNVIKSEL